METKINYTCNISTNDYSNTYYVTNGNPINKQTEHFLSTLILKKKTDTNRKFL